MNTIIIIIYTAVNLFTISYIQHPKNNDYGNAVHVKSS